MTFFSARQANQYFTYADVDSGTEKREGGRGASLLSSLGDLKVSPQAPDDWLVGRSVGLSVDINQPLSMLMTSFWEPTRLPPGVGVKVNVTWRVGPRLVVFTVYRSEPKYKDHSDRNFNIQTIFIFRVQVVRRYDTLRCDVEMVCAGWVVASNSSGRGRSGRVRVVLCVTMGR